MSKLLFLLLFALVQSQALDNITEYDINKINVLQGNNILELNVKEGEEFYLKLKGNPSIGYFWRLLNYDKIPDSLEDLNKQGEAFKYVSDRRNYDGKFFFKVGGTYYYKFKALKQSYNEIALKFAYSREITNEPTLVVKINIA